MSHKIFDKIFVQLSDDIIRLKRCTFSFPFMQMRGSLRDDLPPFNTNNCASLRLLADSTRCTDVCDTPQTARFVK